MLGQSKANARSGTAQALSNEEQGRLYNVVALEKSSQCT